ncbi:MAG: hypothetical protein IJ593_12665 [Lachnospiraceae bacterium]|nr:hypothetical protein [Lachnospiraceae bacterium]
MKIDILILYEHVQRELKNACILKVLLERKGYTVKIDNVAWRKGLLNLKYMPKLIISPSCQDDYGMNYILHNYVGAYSGGYKILNLYSEQLASSTAENLLSVKESALNIYHIAWGKYTYDLIMKSGLKDCQVCITGSQRLDYCREIFKKLNVDKKTLAKKFNLDIDKKWLLLVGNFPAKDETKIEYLESVGYNNFKELNILTKDTYYELINWYKALLCDKELKDKIELIYRPHPNEIVEDILIDLQKEYSNFHIISDYVISDWAINIDFAYIWTSTSSIEISATNVPIVSLVPLKMKEYFEMPLVKYIQKIVNIDELLIATKDVLIKGNVITNEKFYNELAYYYEETELSASENIVNFINKIMASDDYIVKSKFSIFKGLAKTIVYFYEYILYKLNIGLNKYLKVRFRDMRSNKYINEYCDSIRVQLFGE